MPNDVALTDTPPVYSTGTDLSGRQGDINSTAAAQKFDAVQLVAAVLTRAVLVVSRLTAAELAGQGISGTAATQPYDHDGSFATSDDAELAESDYREDCKKLTPHRFVEEAAEKINECNNFHDCSFMTSDDAELAESDNRENCKKLISHRFVEDTAEKINECDDFHDGSFATSDDAELAESDAREDCEKLTPHRFVEEAVEKINECNDFHDGSFATSDDAELAESDAREDCEKPTPHQFVEKAAEKIKECDDLAMHTTLSAGGSHISICSSASSSSGSDYHFSCSQESTHSLMDNEHLSLHQVGSTEQCVHNSSSKCDDRDVGDSESLSGKVCIEMEEPFYTEEEGS